MKTVFSLSIHVCLFSYIFFFYVPSLSLSFSLSLSIYLFFQHLFCRLETSCYSSCYLLVGTLMIIVLAYLATLYICVCFALLKKETKLTCSIYHVCCCCCYCWSRFCTAFQAIMLLFWAVVPGINCRLYVNKVFCFSLMNIFGLFRPL